MRFTRSVAISPDSRWLVTTAYDGVRVWDFSLERKRRYNSEAARRPASAIVLQHDNPVRSLAFTSDGRWLVTAGDDKIARLWDLNAEDLPASLRELRGHDGTITSVAISRDSRWLVTGSDDKTARLWDLNIDSLIERAHRVAGRELSQEERKRYLLDGL